MSNPGDTSPHFVERRKLLHPSEPTRQTLPSGSPAEVSADGKATPLAICPQDDCSSCDLDGALNCRQGLGDVADFMIPAAMFFVPCIGSMVVMGYWQALAIWAGFAIVFFTYIQQKLVCCRCPHYAGQGHFLKCHAAFGLPKIPKYTPRPLGRVGQILLMACFAVLFLFPFPFLIMARRWLLLIITGWALFSWIWFVHRRLCVRCINLFCPFNRLPQALQTKLKVTLSKTAGAER